MASSRYWLFVLAPLLSGLGGGVQSSSVNYANEVLVGPGVNSSCCLPHQNSSVCQNIDIALRKCRRNSTIYKLEAGIEHYLSNGTDVFTNIRDVALVSSNDSEVEVQCKPGAGLAFDGSTNIVISNVRFLYCGALRDSTSKNFSSQNFSLLMFKVTLYFYQCTSVTLDRVAVVNSTDATGVVMYDTVGTNSISHSEFSGNINQSNCSGVTVVGGGGFLVEFTYCKPGDNNCTSDDSLQSHINSDSLYAFINCTFERNYCYGQKLPDRVGAFIYSTKENHTSFGTGGGLSLYFKSDAANNSIIIRDCNFTSNGAVHGCGFHFAFEDQAINNTLHVVSSWFLGNQPSIKHDNQGGGIRGLFYAHNTHSNSTGNIVNISNCTFQGNSAFHGGGLSMSLALQLMSYTDQLTNISIENCVFDHNTGKIGSAVEITLLPMFAFGQLGRLCLSNCTFTNNIGRHHQHNKSYYSNSLGAVYINEVSVSITGQALFKNNTGSAMVVSGTQVSFQSCNATFINNTGINGGAIALLGASYMLLNENSTMTFEGNSATQYGGAIYNNYVVQTDMRFYIKCFIRYISDSFTDPNEWKVKFRFKENTASLLGQSIYSTSLYPCSWSFDSTKNTAKIFCWHNWDYSGKKCSNEISSGPSNFTNIDTNIQTYPGQIFRLKLEARDELEHNITNQTVYSAKICKDNSTAQVEPQFAYTADRYLAVTGEGNQNVTLELDTAGEQDWHIDIQLELMKCPPGMNLTNSTGPATSKCVCPQNNTYGGLLSCNEFHYKVKIRKNYWIGNVSDSNDSKWFVGSCPYFYCMNSSDPDFVTLANTTKDLVPQICKKQKRRGILCGKCIDGYAVAINSYEYTCVACNRSSIKRDIVIYFATAYVPIFIFFLLIIFFNIRLTTGPMNAFIVFAQVISSVNMFDIPVTLDKYPYIHKAYTFIYGIFNLNFFSYLLDPFCVNENFSTLDVLSLDYCIAAFPLVMIGLITLVIRLKDRFNCDKFCRFTRIDDSFILRVFKIKNMALLHTFVAFCLFSYTKFSQASTLMITTFLLTAEDGSLSSERRVYLAGQYTIKDPIFIYKYGLPSTCIFVVFVILPPLLLLGPLNWFNNRASKYRILRKLWPYDKVHIILDTFQGCFKPKMRFFAGVYFLFRLLAFISYAFSNDILQRYILQQILVSTVSVLLALLQPYQSKILNYIDTSIFFVLSVINSLSLFTVSQYNASDHSYHAPKSVLISQFVLIFLPLLGMAFYGYSYFMWNTRCCQKLKNKVSRLFEYCYREYGDPEEEQPLIANRPITHPNEAVNDDSILFERANQPNTFLHRPRPASISLQRSGSVIGSEEDGKALLADYGSQDTTSGIASQSKTFTNETINT